MGRVEMNGDQVVRGSGGARFEGLMSNVGFEEMNVAKNVDVIGVFLDGGCDFLEVRNKKCLRS